MNYDFPCHITGDTWSGITSITIKTAGTPVDLTDCKVLVQIKSESDIASPIFCEFSSEKGDISILPPYSSGNLSILPKIVDIPAGMYQYELKIEFPSGIKRTYLRGTWQIVSGALMQTLSGTRI